MAGNKTQPKQLSTRPVRNFFKEIDDIIIEFWKKNNTFEKSIKTRPENNQFVFFDGPPFPTGTPHYGHLLVSAIKDMVARYQTMLGKRVERQWGWDCHGIYVEQKVEKELGIKNRSEIGKKISEEEFIQACYNYVQNVSGKWPWYVDHIGRWADMKNAYWTLNKDYMESVIWAFKQIYDKGYVYKGKKVLMHCPRCVTPISKFEIAMANSYKDLEDDSVYVKMQVLDNNEVGKQFLQKYDAPVYLLVWTTTPWTLPENAGIAVDKNQTYVTVNYNNEYYVLAKPRLENVFSSNEAGEGKSQKYDMIDEYKGEKLVGLSYKPLFDYFVDKATEKDFKVYPADFVTMEEGTGLVHMAPAYGEDDYNLAQEYGFSVFEGVSDTGEFFDFIKDFAGMFFRDANKHVIENLNSRGLLFKQEKIVHSYPVCPRCDTPLMYKATDSYFINLQDHKKELLEQAEKISWIPEHLKHGRFKYIIESAPDWNISRTRYWSVPIPIWKCDKCGHEIAVGSVKEIEERSGKKVTDLHRPYIDQHTFKCDKCGGTMHRVTDVLDVWFESGSMPYASKHYPFENKEKFENNFPADFVVEGLDQTRGWFNALHRISTLIFNKPAFKNVICHGVILGEDGYKMSKSRKNYPDPEPTIEKYGGDALRLYLLSSAVVEGDSVPFSEKDLAGTLRDILIPYLNVYRYFAIYANKYNFKPTKHILFDANRKDQLHVLDKWVFNKVHKELHEVKKNLDTYHVMNAARKLRQVVDDISMWYIKRSRDRFVQGDKTALATLFWLLWDVNRAFAPFIPFVTEYIHQELRKVYDKAQESVHLEYYPELLKNIDQELIENMQVIRDLASGIHKLRIDNKLPVKQPLSEAVIIFKKVKAEQLEQLNELVDILKGEVNVDSITLELGTDGIKLQEYENNKNYAKLDSDQTIIFLNTYLTDELKQRRIVREFLRGIQVMRKELKLGLEDRITVKVYAVDDIVVNALENYKGHIMQQGGITELNVEKSAGLPNQKEAGQSGNISTGNISKTLVLGPDNYKILCVIAKQA